MAITSTSASYVKPGDTIEYTPDAATPAGSIVRVCGLFGLAVRAIAANERGALQVLHPGEVIEVTTDEAIGATEAGAPIYIVDATGVASASADDATLIGYARKAIAADALAFQIVCA